MVSVLQDGTRAYVANQRQSDLALCSSACCSWRQHSMPVSVINLTTNTLTQTLYSLPDNACQATKSPTLALCGHPAYIAATTGTPTGKVYVVSKDSNSCPSSAPISTRSTPPFPSRARESPSESLSHKPTANQKTQRPSAWDGLYLVWQLTKLFAAEHDRHRRSRLTRPHPQSSRQTPSPRLPSAAQA